MLIFQRTNFLPISQYYNSYFKKPESKKVYIMSLKFFETNIFITILFNNIILYYTKRYYIILYQKILSRTILKEIILYYIERYQFYIMLDNVSFILY